MSDHTSRGQAISPPTRKAALLVLILLTAALSGCGKKPAYLDPPPGVEEDPFPRTYPDMATDPKP